MLGNPTIKKNLKGTETDRYWKVDNYMNTEITVHLYIRPKNKKGSKSLVQGAKQLIICSYVFNILPEIYNKVFESKRKALECPEKSGSKTMVKCDDCNFKSTIIQMKLHIKNIHNRKALKTSKRASILTPLPNPEKRSKIEIAPVSDFALINSESPLHESALLCSLEEDVSTVAMLECRSSSPTQHKSVEGSIFCCDVCPFDTESKKELDEHYTKGDHLFNCTACDLIFMSEVSLNDHEKLEHAQVQESAKVPKTILIRCNKCDFHATTQATLNEHMMTSHTPVRSNFELNSEHNSKQQEKSDEVVIKDLIKCEICDYSSEVVKDFIAHILSKHSNKYVESQISCSVCTYMAKSQSELQEHHQTYHVGMSCEYCNETLNNEDELKQHVFETHPDVIKLNTMASQVNQVVDEFSTLKQALTNSEALISKYLREPKYFAARTFSSSK